MSDDASSVTSACFDLHRGRRNESEEAGLLWGWRRLGVWEITNDRGEVDAVAGKSYGTRG